jgi:hypothetical protein
MEYVNNLTKGSGKGKIGAVLGITSVISFKNLHIGHTTLKTYKDFLEQYVGYDKVYIISTSIKEQKVNEYYDRDSIIFGIDRPNLLNDLEIDDIFCKQHVLIFFGGALQNYFFSLSNRVVEWYKEHGDGHFYTIQDDPDFMTINPLPKIECRLKHTGIEKPKPFNYDENTDDAKLFIEYQKTGLLHQCFNNTIVAHCGSDYPKYYNARINIPFGSPNVVTEPKYWCKFNCYIWQGVNCNLEEKFKDYPLNRKYQSEYHGYIKHDKERVQTTLSYYNELTGPIKVIEGKGHFSDDFKNCDKFGAVGYSEIFEEICKDSFSTFITANASTFDDFISPRYFDCMMADIIPFVYHKYDSNKNYTDDQELKDFMYVSSPEEFKEKVESLIQKPVWFFRHIKYLQRKSIYDKFNDFMTDESKAFFEKYLEENKDKA